MTEEDLQGLSDAKLQFIVDNGDPAGSLFPLAKAVLAKRAPAGPPPQDFTQGPGLEPGWSAKAPPEPPKILTPPTGGQPVTPMGALPDIEQSAAVARQATGTVAGAMNLYPGLVPSLEAIGEAAQTLVPSQRQNIAKVWPTPGSTEAAIEAAPSPLAARVGGATAGIAAPMGYLGKAAGMAGRALQAPATRIFQNVRRILPGQSGIAELAAGAGTGAAITAGEQVVSQLPRIPDRIARGEAPIQMPLMSLLPGAVISGAMSLPAAGQRWAVKPLRSGDSPASTYAESRRSGQYDEPEYRAASDEGPAGVRALGDRRVGQAKEQARSRIDEEFPVAKRQIDERVGRATEAVETEYAQTAAEQARSAKTKFERARTTSKEGPAKLEEAFKSDPDFVGKDGQPLRFDTTDVNAAIRSHVAKVARQGTAATSAEEAAQSEVHLGPGKRLRRIEDEVAGEYLGENATLLDLQNAIDMTAKQANAGTGIEKFLYGGINRILRQAIKTPQKYLDPSVTKERAQTIADKITDSKEKFAIETTARTRTRQEIWGGAGDEEGLGPRGQEGVALITPQEEMHAADFFITAGKRGPQAAKRGGQYDEIHGQGYSDELFRMAAAGGTREEQLARLAANKEIAERNARRGIESEARVPVEDAQEAALRMGNAKRAEDIAKFPQLHQFAPSVALAAAGLTMRGPHAAAMAALGGAHLYSKLAPYARARAAYHLPPAGEYNLMVPDLMAMVALANRRRKPEETAKTMVDAARRAATARIPGSERIPFVGDIEQSLNEAYPDWVPGKAPSTKRTGTVKP